MHDVHLLERLIIASVKHLVVGESGVAEEGMMISTRSPSIHLLRKDDSLDNVIDLSVLVHRRLDDLFSKVCIHDVACKGNRVTARICDELGNLFCTFAVQVCYDDFGTMLSKEQSSRLSDSLTRASNDGDLAFEQCAGQISTEVLR